MTKTVKAAKPAKATKTTKGFCEGCASKKVRIYRSTNLCWFCHRPYVIAIMDPNYESPENEDDDNWFEASPVVRKIRGIA